MLALLGVGRLNAFRLNYLPRTLTIQRFGVVSATLNGQPLRVRAGSMSVRDVLNDAPNTCSFIADNATPPTVGGRLRVTVGIPVQTTLVFSGTIQKATETYVGRPTVKAWQCEAIDDTWVGDWLRPFGEFDNLSATDLVNYLVAYYTPGMSAVVEPGLPVVSVSLDGTTRFNDALTQICKLIGGYFYWQDSALHLFMDPEPGLTPDPIDGAPGRFLLNNPPLSYASDDAQIRTRNYGKGHAENTLTAIDAGEPRIPIADAVMFAPAGGQALAGVQRVTYTGTVLGGTGALVGPGVTPSAPPLVVATAGAGVTGGAHNYALTWVTANGETLPSPVASLTVAGSAPTPQLDYVSTGVGSAPGYSPPAGTVLRYRIYICTGDITNGSTLWSQPSPDVVITSDGHNPILYFTVTPAMQGRYVLPFRNDGSGWKSFAKAINYTGFTTPFAANEPLVQQGWVDPLQYIGTLPTTPGSLVASQVTVTGIAVGPSGTTARNLYRTAAYASSLQLLATIADNATTTYVDAVPDGALGAAPPSSDTSKLQMAAGQVNVGQTTMPVSSTVWALPGGGWAIVGNGDQVIKYAGISGNTIVGIPASGNGSIVAPVNYNSTLTGAPMLTGSTWMPRPGGAAWVPIPADTPVAIWVQCDDVAAQQALAQRYPTGIIENILVDGRRGIQSLTSLCDADLAMYSRPIVTVQYYTLDPKTKSGRPVTVNLPVLGINTTLTIQDVTIDQFGVGPVRFQVTASSLTITLESILRTLADGLNIDG